MANENKTVRFTLSKLGYFLGKIIALIPTKVSDLSNDSGFLTEHQSLDAYLTSEDAAATYATKNDIAKVYKYKGTKATTNDLPTEGNEESDVWHVNADGGEYAWNGSAWELLGLPEPDEITNAEIDALFETNND